MATTNLAPSSPSTHYDRVDMQRRKPPGRARSSAIAKAVVAGVLLLSSARAQSVTRTPTTSVRPRPSRTAPSDLDVVLTAINDTAASEASPVDAPFTAGTVHPTETLEEPEAEVIGGPQTRSPAPTTTESESTSYPATVRPSYQPTQSVNITQTATPPVHTPAPSTNTPALTSSPLPVMKTGSPSPSISTSPPSNDTTPSLTTLSPSDREIDPASSSPSPQTPQALKVAPRQANKAWLIMAFVGGIAGIATGVTMLLWRDTRRYKTRSEHGDEPPRSRNKNTSSDMEHDWYEASPSLSSMHASVDTFMGRVPGRNQSEPHVSSRAASTAELMNISSAEERSTRSDPSDRSQDIHSVRNGSTAYMPNGLMVDHPVDAQMRRSSSPQLSFGDDDTASIDWLEAACIPSAASMRANSSCLSPTESDQEGFSDSMDDEDDCDSRRTLRRFSNGSTYSAVPSAILGERPSVSSTASDWSRIGSAGGGV